MLFDPIFRPIISIFIELNVKLKINQGWEARIAHINSYIMIFRSLSSKEIQSLSKKFFSSADNGGPVEELGIALSTIYKGLDYLIQIGNIIKVDDPQKKYGYKYQIAGITEFYFLNPLVNARNFSKIDKQCFSRILTHFESKFSPDKIDFISQYSSEFDRNPLYNIFLSRVRSYLRYLETYVETWDGFVEELISFTVKDPGRVHQLLANSREYYEKHFTSLQTPQFVEISSFIEFFDIFQLNFARMYRNYIYDALDANLICHLMFLGPLSQEELQNATNLSRGKISQSLSQFIERGIVVKQKIQGIRKPLFDIAGNQDLFSGLILADFHMNQAINLHMIKLREAIQKLEMSSTQDNPSLIEKHGYPIIKDFIRFCDIIEPMFHKIFQKYKLIGIVSNISNLI